MLFMLCREDLPVCLGGVDPQAGAAGALDVAQSAEPDSAASRDPLRRSWSWDSGSLLEATRNLPRPEKHWEAPRLGLVLSGGGGRGIAQIGALAELERAGIPLHCIVGTSMGAVVGGLYASGYSPGEIDSLLRQYDWNDLFGDRPDRQSMYTGRKEITGRHLLQVRLRGLTPVYARSISSGQRVSEYFSHMVRRAPLQAFGDFDKLRPCFRAVATDLEDGSLVELGVGDLAEAMRASMSVPILFQPVEQDGLILIDGGIVSNIPVASARCLGADQVLVVDTTSPFRNREEIQEAWEVADQVITLMQAEKNSRSLEDADFVARPRLGHMLLADFSRRDEMIEAGAASIRALLPELQARLSVSRARAAGVIRWDSLRVELLPPEGGLSAGEGAREGDPVVLSTRSGDLPLHRGIMTQIHASPLGGAPGEISEACLHGLFAELDRCGTCESIRVELLEGENGNLLALTLRPTPGIRGLRLSGLEDMKHQPLEELAAPVKDGRIDRHALSREIDELLKTLRRQGYSLCELDSLVVFGDTLELRLRPGRLDEVRVAGLRSLNPKLVLREFRPRRGEVFQLDLAERSVKRIYATGLYSQVYLRLLREGGLNIAELRLVEKEFPVLRAGLRYSSVWEGKGFLEVLWENLAGGALRAELIMVYGAHQEHGGIVLESDRIWKTLLTSRLSLERDREIIHLEPEVAAAAGTGERLERERLALEFRAGQQIQRLGGVYLTGALESARERGGDTPDWERHIRLRALSLVDSRDRTVFTENGEYHVVYYENVVAAEDPGRGFFRTMAAFDSWRTLSGRHTGHSTVLWALSDAPHRRELFEFGGDRWLRSLGPREAAGRHAMGLRLEYRPRLLETPRGALHLGLRWSALGFSFPGSRTLSRKSVLQEVGARLSLDSVLGGLSAGAALLTESHGWRDAGHWRLWAELGFDF